MRNGSVLALLDIHLPGKRSGCVGWLDPGRLGTAPDGARSSRFDVEHHEYAHATSEKRCRFRHDALFYAGATVRRPHLRVHP